MFEFLRQFRDGIAQAWAKLSLSARVNLALAGAAVAAVILLLAFFGAQPQYVALSSGLAADEAARVATLLQDNGFDYRLTNNNQTITVPAGQRSDIQLLLASNDLPVGPRVAPGFELFQQTELMSNQWLQDVKFMRAVQGEVQRQLNAFDFVDYSYVLIREAQDELFATDQKPSEAAVTLGVNRPLTKREIQAVVNIVANAGGPNLNTGNITVTTTAGEVLHLPAQSEYAAIANSKLEYIAELEQQRERRIMATLDAMGVRGTARVSAQVDFDTKEIKDDKVSEGTELSTFTTSTTTSSRESLPEGTPGAFANVPESGENEAPGTQEEMTEEITNFEPSRTMTTTKTDPGDVVKYVVSLVVEGAYAESTDAAGAAAREYEGLTGEQRTKYEDIARAAVGEGRETTEVTVHDHPFDIARLGAVEAAQREAVAVQWRVALGDYAWTAGQIALILVAFLMVRRLLRRAIAGPELEDEAEEVQEIPAATREDMRRQEVSREISRLARDEPDSVAALLRTWMTQEED